MIIFEIESMQVNEKSGVKAEKPWKMRFQQVSITGHYVDGFAAKYPRETTIQLEDEAPAYPVGRYALAAESYFFGDFGRFTLGRLKLVPLKDYFAEMQAQLGVVISVPQPKAA